MSLPQLITKTADATWIACALLHKENPEREGFRIPELIQRLKKSFNLSVAYGTLEMHISSYCVANNDANPVKYRYLYRLNRGFYKLFRPDDPFHRRRDGGDITPIFEEIPKEYQELLEWYKTVYCDQKSKRFREAERSELEPSHVRITNGSIKIPEEVLNYLGLREGDPISISRYTNNTMLIKKARIQYL
ncbi:MAG: hypothetical protein COA77_03665 [Thaumarchaeota archaeon]|nr:MAG: hypothetical protein COA77_03665 [Nitrososphaerota archaeon]